MLEPGTHEPVNRGHHFRIVQPILGLALELRLLHEYRQHARHALANVVGGERHALGREVVRVDVIAHGLAEAGAQAVFMRAARSGRDAVDVTAKVFIRRLRPLQHDLELDAVLFLERERRLVHRLDVPIADDLPEVIDETLGVLVHVLLPSRLVFERDPDAAMQVAGHFEALADDLRLEFDLREDLRIRLEEHGRAGAARRADLLQAACRLALLEGHLVLLTITLDGGNELTRQRVHDARTDTVQAARGLVVAGFELSAGMQHGEDHLERAFLRLRVDVHRNAAPIVFDGDRGAVRVQRHANVARVTVHRFVDRVVERLPDEMVQARAADAADVHAGALPDGLEAFEDGDVFRCVVRCHCGKLYGAGHLPCRCLARQVPGARGHADFFFDEVLRFGAAFFALAARFGFGVSAVDASLTSAT